MPHGIHPPELAAAHAEIAGSKYQPSNGTEGEIFIDSWCGSCARSGAPGRPDDAGEEIIGCSITGRTMAFSPEDDEYPVEWQYGADGQPRCTAWVAEGEPIPTPRCQQTLDMFGTEGHGDG